jgi:hypothetical protein
MTGDCHVRFCESRGLQCPRPLAYGNKHETRKRSKKYARKKAKTGISTRGRTAR